MGFWSWEAFCENGPISAGFHWRKDDDMQWNREASRSDAVSVLMRILASGFLFGVSVIWSSGNEIGFRVE